MRPFQRLRGRGKLDSGDEGDEGDQGDEGDEQSKVRAIARPAITPIVSDANDNRDAGLYPGRSKAESISNAIICPRVFVSTVAAGN